MDVAKREDMTEDSGLRRESIEARANGLAPEERLIWLACRAELDPVREELLRRTVDDGLDWGRLARKGRYHRMLDLLRHHLDGVGRLAAVPADALTQMEESRLEARRMQARLDAARPRCISGLSAAGVEHLLVKGPTLQPLYPQGVVRAAGDLDLLIHEDDLARATAALSEAGFVLQTPVPPGLSATETVAYCQTFEQLRYVDGDGAEVELHFRLHNYGPPTAGEMAWESVATWCEGDAAPQPGLGAEELFLYLVCHLNLHAFGRILWYYDVAEFYRAWRGRLDWEGLAALAQKRRLGPSFHQSLTWILELLHPELDPEPGLGPLTPTGWQRSAFRRLWRHDEVNALTSWIRPFDASRYYLLGGDPWWRKAAYLRQVLLPPRPWLAAHLGCQPTPGILWRYLINRRRESRDWARITRKDVLLDGAPAGPSPK